jgi:hypothetical protein
MDAITALITSLWQKLGAGWEWLLSEKGKDITGILSNLATIIPFVAAIVVWLFLRARKLKRQPTPIEPKANADLLKRNRQRILETMRHDWIEGFLEQSLYRIARLELGLKESPEMVEHSWNLVVEQPGHQSEPIRAGTPMIELFDRFDKTLLILGAPGAGKTTLLLELARDLIKRAKNEKTHPIPVIFHLSSWALKRPTIHDWLIDELQKRYKVKKKIARFWIENEAILPLLDGLDEVALEHRNACVDAINTFRENNGLLPIAICSRIADYEALTTKLHLQHAVTVQPLTSEQVDRYLTEAGKSLEAVRKVVRDDTALIKLLDNPLMLSIMQIAFYNNADAAIMLENESIEKRRGKLFDAYIAKMFKLRGGSAPYQPAQTRHWIIRLAKSMLKNDQAVYYINQIQPELLSTKHQKIFKVLSLTAYVLILGLSLGFFVRMGWMSYGLASGLFTGFGYFRIKLGLSKISPLSSEKKIDIITDNPMLSMFYVQIFVVPISMVISLFFGPHHGLSLWLYFSLFFGLLYFLLFGGFDVLQHYVLRFLLWREGFAPLRYVRFLDHAADLLFLRKVGGGYIFVHRMIMEHFAAMENPESLPDAAASGSSA